jgi:hypothetical protein
MLVYTNNIYYTMPLFYRQHAHIKDHPDVTDALRVYNLQ